MPAAEETLDQKKKGGKQAKHRGFAFVQFLFKQDAIKVSQCYFCATAQYSTGQDRTVQYSPNGLIEYLAICTRNLLP